MNKMTMTKVGKTDVRVTRRFNAAPQAVYDAHLDADKVQQWMQGPDDWKMVRCTLDGRPGGAFSYTWADGSGEEQLTVFGKFLELTPPHQIVHEEAMDMGGEAAPMVQITTDFAADGTGTLMTMVMSYPSAEDRDGAVEFGIEDGMAVFYSNLDKMIA